MMETKIIIFLVLMQLQRVLNTSLNLHHFKRSPLDIQPIGELGSTHKQAVADIPLNLQAQNVAIPQPSKGQILSNRKKKGPNIETSAPHQLLIPVKFNHAVSKVHHSSVHTNLKHYITKGNVKVPILMQTLSHSNSTVTHPTKLFPILFPIQTFHTLHGQPTGHQQAVIVPDLSVIPLHHQNNPRNENLARMSSIQNKDDYEDSYQNNRYRSHYGGFGVGWDFGGHGAGHGYWAYG